MSIKQMRERRAVVDIETMGSYVRKPTELPPAETYVPVSEVPATAFESSKGSLKLPKIQPMEMSSPPGGFRDTKFVDAFTRESRPVEEEMIEFSIDTLCASAYLISCPKIDTRVEDFVMFFKLVSTGVNGSATVFHVERIKLMITYIHCEGLSPYVEYSKAASDLGSKILVRAMYVLFADGHNAVKFDVESEIVTPAASEAAVSVLVSVEDNIKFKDELANDRFDYVKSLVGVNHSTSAWSKLIADKRYDLPDNVAGRVLSDKPGLSIGQVFPFPSAGRMILAVQALDELFDRKGIALVLKDKRNALFDPHHLDSTEYNRIVPYGTNADSMARCALTYGFSECAQAYARAYLSLKSSSAEDKRKFPIHERFLHEISFSQSYLDDQESEAVSECRYWLFDSAAIADIDLIVASMKLGKFCLSYVNTALQARKNGAEFYLFCLDPGLFLVLLVPKFYGKFISKKVLVEKKIDNDKLSCSVYMGNVTTKNVKKIHNGFTKLTIYAILGMYGIDCTAKIKSILGEGSTPLDKLLSRSYDYMIFKSHHTWYYVFIPSFGAKHLLDIGDAETAQDQSIESGSDDDFFDSFSGDGPGGTISEIVETGDTIELVVSNEEAI